MYDNDSITLRFKVDVDGCMFCNISISRIYRGEKNVINLHNNFDLLWLFFSAHFHFIDLYKMNLDFFMFKLSDHYICPTSFIVCCVLLIDKYLPFSVHKFNKVF